MKKQNKVKFKFVNNPHIYLEKKEICNKDNCGNVHLWFNKRAFEMKIYSVSFINLSQWKVGWCLAKEICIPEKGWIKEFTKKLEEPGRLSVEFSREVWEDIFSGHEENWKLNTW